MENRMSVTYWVKREKTFAVEVKAWYCGSRWNWCVYAHIFESHPKFNDEDLTSFPMHGGVTFDEVKTTQPINGVKYHHQKVTTTKTIGCDFAHTWDDYENHPSPFDCKIGRVPQPFCSEADYIAKALQQDVENYQKYDSPKVVALLAKESNDASS